MMKPMMTALALCLGLTAPQAQASATRPVPFTQDMQLTSTPGITLAGDQRYRSHYRTHRSERRAHRHERRRHRGERRAHRHSHVYRRSAPQYYYVEPRRPAPVILYQHVYPQPYAPRYHRIPNPRRYGLHGYRGYAQDNRYVYGIDPDTGRILALIGLVSAILR